jgi:NADH oxidase (H2O2-forming)
MITGQPVLSQLGTTAERQGKVAGINMAGSYSAFPGILDSAVSTFFDLEVGVTGFTESAAHQQGFDSISGTIRAQTRAKYYPGGKEIFVKIVAEPELGKVIGGQIIGGEEVTQRVNMISIAIQKQACVSELAKADTCYAPSVCSPWEPVVLAAEITARRGRARAL